MEYGRDEMDDNIFNIDATALFYARPTPDHFALLDVLNGYFASEDGCYLTKSNLSHDDWWLLSCERFHIMISFNDNPAPAARFESAVHSPINALNRFEYEHVAANHYAHLSIEIGDGSAPLPPEARKIMQEFGTVATCDPALKMKALNVASQFIADHPGFLAMHFGPSDRMLSPDDLKKCAGQDMPTALLTHPVPTEAELDVHGRETYHLRLKHPQHLPGPAIDLESIPRAVPLATAVNLLNTLMKAHGAGKIPLAQGDVLSPSKKWSLYVHRLAADEDAPKGRVVLSFYKDRVVQSSVKPQAASEPARETAQAKAQPEKAPIAARALAKIRKSAPKQTDAAPTAAAPKRQPKIAADTSVLTNIVSTPKPAARSVVPPELKPIETTPEPAFAPADAAITASEPKSTSKRVSLLSWMVDRCTTLPVETRVRVSGIALIAGVLTLANPYEGFTGGHTVNPDAAYANMASQSNIAPIRELAALWN